MVRTKVPSGNKVDDALIGIFGGGQAPIVGVEFLGQALVGVMDVRVELRGARASRSSPRTALWGVG